ncbi:Acyl-CoA dehydrogenase [Aliarcobacter thereius]|uniref:Acyl-CoA dehydrogenase n=1 Tax=Aliarcobacter thereius TaxID=544718 RepID=A0A1C0B3Y2_9BACT|nr:acyl-CoA dehydrogenase family protein [Aliarcobacter thereius]OCL86038.1 Acyl-CoA dehydrogenase [Aliarcobacter thereius]OCL96963.1 Acyl-CoA dehydrogenase [Aliarcobacter thereius]TLS71085.1 acyl-CoA dehydrogenase [Aliarcobacter thereius]TLT06689.1 acyl-CoA dehydrogenase [Aliarcobacter thereius]
MSNLYDEMLDFAKKNIAPFTDAVDNEARFPLESFEAIKDKRITGLLVPKEFGGMGLGFYEHTQTILAFANHCATTALCYMMHNVATNCLVAHGNEELKNEFLPKIANGEIMLALAYSESGTGTHFYIPEIEVTKDENNILNMNGRKSFVTSAQYADYYLIDANSFDSEGLDNWIVSKDLNGITFEHNSWNGLGMRGNASCPMILDNVKIDKKFRIGEAGNGLEQIMNTVGPFFIMGLAAVYSGVALNACNTITLYSMNRKYSDNSALCNIPTVQNHLADIYTKATGAKYFTLNAAQSVIVSDPFSLANVISARINASNIAVDVCTKAMKIGGGTAYAKRINIERLLRDSLASAVMAPSTDVLTTWLGKAITNQDIL